MFYRYEHSMPISHIAFIVNMVHMIIWFQNLGMSFMIWFTTGLPWFHGDDQSSGWEQLEIYFGVACSGENTRPPENKKQGKETKNKKNKFDTPPERKRRKVQHRKEKKEKNSATPKEKKEKKGVKWKEKKK